jgi:hypothetical protein
MRWLAAFALSAAVAGCASVLGDDYEFVECPYTKPPEKPTLLCDGTTASDDECFKCIDCTGECMCAAPFAACSSKEGPCKALYDCLDPCITQFPNGGPDYIACDNACEQQHPEGVGPRQAKIDCWDRECPVSCN